jgi:transcriptional regulator with PAS, ATPase and Fis domain
VKLLRAIQEKEVRPVGGTKSFRVDVRILTATHRDLKTLSSEGKFREDLYFRLAGYELHVPSLRERTQDLKALCHNILENLAKEMGSKKPHLSAKAFECLGRYSFPGNIRDLQNILQWSLLKIGDSKKIDVAHLPPKVSVPEEGDDRVMPLKVAVDAFESDFIRSALERRNGNQSKTARDLGMSRRTLINKMTRYAMT